MRLHPGSSSPTITKYWGASQFDTLRDTLNGLDDTSIVVLASYGAWARYLKPDLAAALIRCGAPASVSDYTIENVGVARTPMLVLVGSCNGNPADSWSEISESDFM